jgi:hypothetical protein
VSTLHTPAKGPALSIPIHACRGTDRARRVRWVVSGWMLSADGRRLGSIALEFKMNGTGTSVAF